MSKGLNWNKRTKKGFMIHEGFITKSLPNAILRVRLENEDISRFYFRKDST
nr:translational initiation factor 1 [Polygala japonica]